MSSFKLPYNSSSFVIADVRDEQILYLPALLWLLDQESARGTGRTHLIAIAWILTAQEASGNPVAGFDHHMGSKRDMERLKDYVLRMMDAAGIHGNFTSSNHLRIPRTRFKLTVPNWFQRYVKQFIRICFREGLTEEELIKMMRDDVIDQVLGA